VGRRQPSFVNGRRDQYACASRLSQGSQILDITDPTAREHRNVTGNGPDSTEHLEVGPGAGTHPCDVEHDD